ncbi:hypothetical protein HMPREF9019_1660 [Hoylesella timonensis CRIS 5C-B1]|uniref:Uncharacterized protein n=1 Tax=Hoylesella timonensis CRIS 5C-B1 TaxID=679189 RepID=D1VYD7_9BACT|nr:hypothetical protein HMPREF9019_1660 [Hoylesella timonensis CRIS 5C-B1]
MATPNIAKTNLLLVWLILIIQVEKEKSFNSYHSNYTQCY